jgi:hypothetical protein
MGIITSFSLLGNVNPYSFPPATQALEVLKYGKILTAYQDGTSYWEKTLISEVEYPAPSTLLAIYSLITNIPSSFLPFLPITGFILLLFYLTILKALLKIDRITDLIKEKSYLVLLFLIIILFDIFRRNDAYYVGRATLGVTFLAISSYMFLMFLNKVNARGPFLSLLLITITASYTYYTTSLAMFIITMLYLLLTYTSKFSNFGLSERSYILALVVTSLFLIIVRPIMSLARAIPLSPEKFISNLMDWILTRLRIEQGEASEFFGEVPLDLFTRVFTVWLGYLIIFFTIFAFALYLVNFINKVIKSKTSRKTLQTLEPADMYAIIVISGGIAELFYTFLIPIISLRLITIFSIFYIPLMVIRIKDSKTKNIVAIFITLLSILFYVGTCGSIALYGKVETAKYILGISSYISFNGVASDKVMITGDSYYTGYLWFMYASNSISNNILYDSHGKVLFTILDRDIYDLFSSHDISRIIYCIKKLTVSDTDVMLVIINDGRPLRGTAWGYMTILSPINMNFLINNANAIYNDDSSFLLKLTSISLNKVG